MQTFLDVANILLPLAYLLVAVAYGFLFFAPHPVASRIATPALRGTVLFHLADLVVLTLRYRQFPASTVSHALSIVAFAVAVVYVFVEWHGRERSTGFWILSMVFFFQLLSSVLMRPNPPDREIFHNPFFALHVSLALLGYAAFVVAAGYAFLFLQLYRELKAGRFSTFYGKLPPLETLERMMIGALSVGFVTLTGAVATGAFWAERLYHDQWLHDPKILVTLATWVLYAAALVLRRLRRWQGRQTALASLAGLCAILFSLVAVNFFFTDFHGFL
ncbi:MAG TPA: cytochrome c biogenesis protein CcsA [Thermoanaerobaculia bacterium]|nr:cytochrome c biogenesis protein CcsA [Thermoanaerobaculia bacterium]